MRRAGLALLVVVALAVRLAFLIDDPQPYDVSSLAGPQGEIAHHLLHDGRFGVIDPAQGVGTCGGYATCDQSVPTLQDTERLLVDPSDVPWRADPEYVAMSIHPQGVALLLAGLWGITGDEDYAWLQVMQAVLGALGTVLVFWLGVRLFGSRSAAVFAAAAWALHPALSVALKWPTHDAWAILLTLAATGAFVAARENGAPTRWLIVVGVLCGAGVAFRPGLALLPVALATSLVPARGVRGGLRFAVVPVAAVLLLIAPWTIRNAVELDRFVPVQTGFGQVLYQGLGERPGAFGVQESDAATFREVHYERPDLRYASPEYDDELRRRALARIGDHPAQYAALLFERTARSTVLAHSTDWVSSGVRREFRTRTTSVPSWMLHHPLGALQLAGGALLEPLLVLLGLCGAVVAWRAGRREEVLILAAVLAATLAIPVAIGTEWRYVAPASFIWILLAGVALDAFVSRAGRGSPPPPAARPPRPSPG